MVKLGWSFSGKLGKDVGAQDGAAMDSVPLISPLDVSQLQPSFPDQVVIKTQTEYGLPSTGQLKKFPDLEAQKSAGTNSEERHGMPAARMIAFAMALLGCVLIMYKAIWYDQLACPDGFLLRHRMCTPLTLEMYYSELDPERHRRIMAALGAYQPSGKPGAELPAPWRPSRRAGKEAPKEAPKAAAQAGAATATALPGKPAAGGEKDPAVPREGSAPPPAPAPQ
ncbi:neuron-specific vesicular protein calcyon isoform 1-T7 [Glossophaga mutica]